MLCRKCVEMLFTLLAVDISNASIADMTGVDRVIHPPFHQVHSAPVDG
jgi:hypothetical protein